MQTVESIWYGFKQLSFEFMGQKALLICPHQPTKEKKWLFKIEYFGAFPAFELAMLERGYYVAHVQNKTRWATPEDIAVWPKFCDFLSEQWGLHKQCVPVGMSCGGIEAVYFATTHPRYVSALYLDAPVMNFLSCPFGLGASEADFSKEFERATGYTRRDMLSYRDHPLDRIPKLVEYRIPVMMVSGDSDRTVPYDENGKLLVEYYRQNGGTVCEIIKPGGDHHPHGLEDNTPILEFVEKYYGEQPQ